MDGKVIGYDKYFTYASNKGKKSNGQWIMHEFSLKEQEATGSTDFVICELRIKIMKKVEEKSRRTRNGS